MAELKAKGTCDFCGEACNADMAGAKAYDCEDFAMPMAGAMSYGAWGACPICAGFIDCENWSALEEHMTAMHSRRFGFLAKLMMPKMRRLHAQQVQLFRQHRLNVQKRSDQPEIVIEADYEFVLALDDAKQAGSLEALRKTAVYKKMLAAITAENKGNAALARERLDSVCSETVKSTPGMTAEMRELVMRLIRENN